MQMQTLGAYHHTSQ